MNDKRSNALNDVFEMLSALGTDQSCLPASYLYNEGWMLRLVLKAASEGLLKDLIPPISHPTKWASEAKLFTPFDAARGNASEGLTNVDGIIGDFDWQPGTRTGVRLLPKPSRFEVFEAKMFSKLSAGVTAAKWYDQAVRNVACMAHTLNLQNLKPQERPLDVIGFWVIAPESQINRRLFTIDLEPGSMRAKIAVRIAQFDGEEQENLDYWREEYFEPLLQQLEERNAIKCTSWEEVIKSITDKRCQKSISEFYQRCIDAAGKEKAVTDGDLPVRGHLYRIIGKATDHLVVVCKAGNVNSRVFVKGSEKPSYLIKNNQLELVDDAEPMDLQIPRIGETYIFQNKTVRVTSNGPCRSKIEPVSEPGPIEQIDNHLLKETQGNS